MVKVKRRSLSMTKLLEATLGGTWKYDGCSDWWCDDEKRNVGRRSMDTMEDFDDPLCPPQYWLYGDGTPKLITWSAERLGLPESCVC